MYVDVKVKRNDQNIDQFRTKSVDIDAEVLKRINDYFDARDKGEGTYLFEMVVYFWNTYKMDSTTFQIELINEGDAQKIRDQQNMATGNAINSDVLNKQEKGSSKAWWIVLIVLLVGIIAAYVGWRYVHREEYEERLL